MKAEKWMVQYGGKPYDGDIIKAYGKNIGKLCMTVIAMT
jgi:hypothetical protein